MNGTTHKAGAMEGRVGLVTGAGTPMGIGRSLVMKLAEAGAAAVYACDLNMSSIPSLQEAVKKAGYATKIEGKLLDVSNEEQTQKVVKDIVKENGRFDFIFPNAGFANYKHLNDMDLSHYDRQIAVMQRGVFLAIKYGSQAMMVTSEQKTTPGGTIVVTGSCAGFLGAYADLAYTTAKTAVNGMVSAASVHLSSSNIRCNGVAPGFTKTSILSVSEAAQKGEAYENKMSEEELKKNHMWFFEQAGLLKATQYYYNRMADAEEIANIQLFLASDASSCINGQVILADSGKTSAATGEGCTGPIPIIEPMKLD